MENLTPEISLRNYVDDNLQVSDVLCGPQVPMLWRPFKCVPTMIGVVAAIVALYNNFKIILVERGAGRNGSTVAVSLFPQALLLITAASPACLLVCILPH